MIVKPWYCESCDWSGDFFGADRHERQTAHAVSHGSSPDKIFAQRRPTAKEWLVLTVAAGILTVLLTLWVYL